MVTAIVPLSAPQTRRAGAMLARAFLDDPLWVHILPDAGTRRRALPAFFTATAEYGRLHGRVDSTPLTDGAAIWIWPATDPKHAAGTEAAEYGPVEEQFDRAAAARFSLMVEHYQALRKRDMPGPHWYLACLGVDPARQRLGIGRSLLEPILQLVDQAGLPCYLETENAVNLRFYHRQGFEVLEQGRLPGGGPEFWTMRRPPLPAEAGPA